MTPTLHVDGGPGGTAARTTVAAEDGAAAGVAVFVHIHYPDIWAGMKAELERRLTTPFHLLVTGVGPDQFGEPLRSPFLRSTRFVAVQNRGRDIRPFLCALSEAPDFEIGLKLHTKKSPQRPDGDAWRTTVMDSLLPADISAFVERLHADKRIGLIAPANFALSVRSWLTLNEANMVRAMALLGEELVEDHLEDAFFPAGSMFWFRRASIARLARPAILDAFEEERGQLDGTMAHALERLFAVVAGRAGYLSLSVPVVDATTPRTPTRDLRALAREHADIPSSYFLAPQLAAGGPATVEQTAQPRGSEPFAALTTWLRRMASVKRTVPSAGR